ncbi:GATOR complex protein isoform 4 [Schistosoma japonicum]|uniref:GATOR complex protein NPRL3 n=1 Tax=Schistosoma japonicum TaxID=6182 RepID=A0A4Z2CRT0_SCHJA|nr:GATOR complex protein isoform 4 [Schistosoma japonicum]
MTDVGSSLIYWDEKEILPRGVFLTSSGSGGDRLLFWQSLNAINDNYKYNLKKDPCTHNGDCSSVVKNANNLDSTSPKDLAFVGSSTMEIIPCPKFKSGSKFRGRKNSENPFALSLISERTMFFNEGTFGNSPITGGLNPNFMGSADRTLNNCSTICSNINSSLCNTSSLSANSPVGSVATNLSNPNIVLGSLYSTDSSLQVPPTKSPLIGNLGISNIEGIPANVLLSLLHQQTQALQRKIYIKLDHSIFIGAAFNLSPSDIETIGLSKSTEDSNTKACDSELSRTTMISFTVGFLMDSSAPPSVLSYLTELSRLIGSQIRRAELVFNYLRDQRDIIVSTLEKYSNAPHINLWSSSSTPDYNANKYISDISNFSKTSQSFPNRRFVKTSEVGNSDEDVNFCNSNADQEFSEYKVLHSLSVNQPTNENVSANSIPYNSDFHEKLNNVTTMNPLEKLVQISSLCAELKSILDSVCKTGHVNVKINKIYPVCFCLPHKAYCLSNNDGISRCMVAVRPMAIWNAMDKIRPYHALLLLLRKSDLLKDYLPTDINPTLKDFVNALSPTISLYNLAQKFHSQSHCLNLALWLIYRGHALIVYPIVANNIYVLAPHSKAWFTPQLIGQFATSFPDVNFAELLTSFSTCFVLKDHFDSSTCNIDNLQYDADVQNRSSNTSWTNLPLTEKINLIAWLLRRRLIIQVNPKLLIKYCYLLNRWIINHLLKTNLL